MDGKRRILIVSFLDCTQGKAGSLQGTKVFDGVLPWSLKGYGSADGGQNLESRVENILQELMRVPNRTYLLPWTWSRATLISTKLEVRAKESQFWGSQETSTHHSCSGTTIKRSLRPLRDNLKLGKGAEVDSVDRYGRTALSYAVWKGHMATQAAALGRSPGWLEGWNWGDAAILCYL